MTVTVVTYHEILGPRDGVSHRRNDDVMHDSDAIHQFHPNPDTDRYRYYVSDDVHFVY